jgi:hypothetical protein
VSLREGSGGEDHELELDDEAVTGHGGRRVLICAACEARITATSARREAAGRHEHVLFNPAGVQFRIGCFSSAPGCGGHGEVSDFFTWFPGYAWQVALCRGCGAHLGWSFRGEGDAFWGLVLPRLREVERGASD